MNLATACSDIIAGAIVEISERNAGNAHVTSGGRLHRPPNHLCGVGDRNQIEIFAEGADQDWLPETFDGVAGLAVLKKPLLKRTPGITLPGKRESSDGARDRDLVFRIEKRKTQERRGGVQRGGQRRSMHDAGAAAGFDKSHVFVPADFIFDADAAVELHQVGADAEENVLAIVDDFAGAGMFVGRSASAEIRAALEQGDAEADGGESAGPSEASQAASRNR